MTNRNYFTKPYQGNGRDSYDYGRSGPYRCPGKDSYDYGRSGRIIAMQDVEPRVWATLRMARLRDWLVMLSGAAVIVAAVLS